ncbi:MAG: hypothetical protein ABI577_00740 [bacterium]
MFNNPSALQPMLPGEPSPEALHREEFFNDKTEQTEASEILPDHRLAGKAALLRAQLVATVGRYFV